MISLTENRYPALNNSVGSANMGPIVLLHGWGGNSETWQPVLEGLREFSDVLTLDLPGFDGEQVIDVSFDEVVKSIVSCLPPHSVLMGWSLGGMLATHIAAAFPNRISALVTMASNLCFSEKEGWPAAMPLATFKQFRESFSTAQLPALKRFMGLVSQGDERERAVLKALREQVKTQSKNISPQWLNSLDMLNAFDNREKFSQLSVPGLHVLGGSDALVPSSAASAIRSLNPRQEVLVFPGVAHAPHWSNPDELLAVLRIFFEKQKFHLDKLRVAQSFSKAAETYDSVAQLQRDVGDRLFRQHLPASGTDTKGKVVVDLGCGTGCFTEQLQQRFSGSDILGLDIAEGMLRYARDHKAQAANWLCGDAESLPLADRSVDIMFSSLAIQWCENTEALFMEIKRVLKPGGRFYFTTLGPKTLFELKQAWQKVDGNVHVNRFFSEDLVKQGIHDAGLELVSWECQDRVLYYPQLKNLTHELKALGAHNVNQGKPTGLTGRSRLQHFRAAYESFRQSEGLPATYEVYYGVLDA